MLKNDRSELDYATLTRMARRLPEPDQGLRIAILADVSIQYLAPVLRALFHVNDIDVQIYQGDYDAIETEAFNPQSTLYSFNPEFVVILQSTEKLKKAYYDYPDGRSTFGASKADRIERVWKAIIDRTGARVLQSTFVTAIERPSGNYGLHAGESLQRTVLSLNRELCLRAQEVPGVLINDLEYIASWIGRRHFIDERLWALTRSLCSFDALPDVAQNIVDIVMAAIGRSVKCVVLDLDNTLWGGVVAEDGIERLGLGDLDPGNAFRHLQHFLLDLSKRGIILAVCSKNDEELARSVFRDHPDMVLREKDIAVFVANWQDKATNIRHIRERLNIGFDTMVFLDDNPFERNLVRQILPDVIVPELPDDPVLYLRTISELNLFETASSSALDSNRTELYREQAEREQVRDQFGGIDEYLQSLDTVATVREFNKTDLPRIAQLIGRSNQFNLTTRRYSEAACAAMISDPSVQAFSVSLSDRFGDFGLISVVILRKKETTLEIDTFLMSCRVLQRGVEQFTMNRIFAWAADNGIEQVVGHYIPTAKNKMVAKFYEQFGFACQMENEQETTEWRLETRDYVPTNVFIRANIVGNEEKQPETANDTR